MRFERLDIKEVDWATLDVYSDRTVHQTLPWLNFLVATQGIEPVVAALLDGGDTLGFFTGGIVRKFGIKILGSPFPGWTTSYMGFNLLPGVPRKDVLKAFTDFAFRDLKCMHFELMDRRLLVEDAQGDGFALHMLKGYEIDLSQSEDQIFAGMKSGCRRCIRKAEKSGVVVEEARGVDFVDDYYRQLTDVFAKQQLVPTYKRERVRALIEHLHPSGMLLLLRALDSESRCIATGIFPAMNDTAYFWGGASFRSGQILRPNEAIQWYAMRYWRKRGIVRYDFGGGGSYKEKYGGRKIAVPWLRKSRFKLLARQRDLFKSLVKVSQRAAGRVAGTAAR